MKTEKYTYHGKEYMNGSWEERNIDNLAALYLGDLERSDNGNLIELQYTMYSDYSGCVVERSNCDVILESFEDYISNGIWEVYGGYGTRGIVYQAVMLKNEEFRDMLKSLDNYPLVNGDHYSNLEFEIENESWEEWIKSDLERLLDENELSYPENEEKFRDKFYKIISDHDIYFIHEDPNSAYMDLDEIIKYW